MGELWHLIVSLGSILIWLALWQQLNRGGQILRGWAEENGYRIVQYQHRRFFKGPFSKAVDSGQLVYRITVEDQHRNLLNGWIRCGGSLFGRALPDMVEVRWDERSRR